MSFASRRHPGTTLRARLSGWYLGILAVSLCLFSAVLYLVLARDLQGHHDDELSVMSARLATALEGSPWTEASIDSLLNEIMAETPLVMVQDEGGRVLYRSPALRDGSAAAAFLPVIAGATQGLTEPQYVTVESEGTDRVRIICCTQVRGLSGGRVHVASTLGGVTTTLHSMGVLSMVVCVPIVLLLTSFGGWVIAGRALRPIAAVTSALQSVQATNLSQRIDLRPVDPELSGLIESVNRLLDRLEQSFAGLREFSANASHQLQTPLTVMRGTLDVALEAPRDAATYRRALEDIVDEQKIMTETIEGLRALSLADADAIPDQQTMLDLAPVCAEAAEIIAALAEPKDISLRTTLTPGIRVRGDVRKLRQILLSLGDNAVKYTDPGGRIDIELQDDGREARLSVTDTGVGIASDDLSRVFDRFYRVDKHRARASGTGLGLAIVKRLVELHNGRVEAASRPGDGSRFTVYLPRV